MSFESGSQGRRARRLLGGALVAVLAVAAGVLTGLGVLPTAVGWTAVALAVAAGAAGLLLTDRRKQRAGQGQDTTLRVLHDTGSIQLLPVDELDPIRLGVHPAWKLPGNTAMPPYIPRIADADLDRALAQGGLVLVQGDSAAGKSRAAYEAVRRLGWPSVLVPRDAAALRELTQVRSGLTKTVVWLDDLERYLSTDNLDDGLLAALCPPGRTDVVLLATLRSQARDALGIDTDESTGRARRVLTRTTPVHFGRRFDRAEVTAAQRHRSDPRIAAALDSESGAGLTEHLAAGPPAVARWQTGRDGENEPGAALISAAVDLRRAGYLEPVPLDWLVELHTVYLSERFRGRLGETDLAGALEWATASVRGASSCLLPVGPSRYLAFDYLVDHAELRRGAPDVPEPVWQRLLNTRALSADQMFRIARAAARFGRIAEASRLWSALAEANDRFAMFNLGWAAQTRDDLATAEQWYARAAEAGNSWAMSNLGTLAERRGEVSLAESWYRRAADAGDTKGMTNLGGLFAQTGRIDQARSAYRRAAATGDPNGLRKEAVLELLHGDRKRGANLLRQVALAGDPAAVRLMGLLSQPEDAAVPRSDVEALRRLAAEMGDSDAALDLARNLWNQGDLDAAEIWFRRAAETENGKVAEFGLAVLLEQRARTEDAESWYRRSAEHGLPEAMLNLGTVLQERGEFEEAEHWYHRALGAGHLPAEVNLGALHWRRGNLAEGHRWYQRAADRGDELAKQALENVETESPAEPPPRAVITGSSAPDDRDAPPT